MKETQPQSNPESVNTPSLAIRDIFIVAAPIIVAATVGNVVGLSTLAGGAIVNLGYVLAVILGAIILKRQESGWRQIGLAPPANWIKTLLLGIGAAIGAIVVFVVMQMIVVGLLTAIGMSPPEIDQSRFNPLEGNLALFILMVVLAWTTIAFGEELFYRAFLITGLISGTDLGKTSAILISGLIFGAVHFAEGPMGILSNSAIGFLFGWIYVRSGYNLWITIVGHGIINTLRFVLLYTGV